MNTFLPFNFGLAIVIFISFTACDIEPEKKEKVVNTEPKAQTKLKWLAHWKGEGKKEQLIYEIIREFSLLNQDIEVEMEFPHDMLGIPIDQSFFGGTVDTISQMTRLNKWPYDVMLCGIYLHNSVASQTGDKDWAKKHLVDFSEEQWFIDAHKDLLFSTDRYTKPYGDMSPGPYIEGVWNILYKSTVVENMLGLKIDEFNLTFADFILAAKKVHEYNQTHPNRITFFSLQRDDSPNMLFTHLAMSILGKPKPENREEAINVLRTAFEQFEQLATYQPLKQNSPIEHEFQLNKENTLFVLYPSYISTFWQKNKPKGEKMMHPCEMPSHNDRKSPTYSGIYHAIFVVPKNAKNKEAALRFMKFMSSADVADKWIKYSQSPTGLKNAISYNDFGDNLFAKFSRHISKKYQSQYSEDNILATLFDYYGNADLQTKDVLNGKISAEMAVQAILEKIDQ